MNTSKRLLERTVQVEWSDAGEPSHSRARSVHVRLERIFKLSEVGDLSPKQLECLSTTGLAPCLVEQMVMRNRAGTADNVVSDNASRLPAREVLFKDVADCAITIGISASASHRDRFQGGSADGSVSACIHPMPTYVYS